MSTMSHQAKPGTLVQFPVQKNHLKFTDVSLSRSFRFEGFRVDFRAESYSVFNIQNWNTPNTSLVSPNYGMIFGKNNPRRFQFGLRVEF